MPASDYTPDLADVGALIRARTVDSNGAELGTFTDDTRPTGPEVQVLIDQAVQWMQLRIGADPAGALVEPAKNLVALYTAMLVESSFYAEQIEANRSQYPQLQKLYDDGLQALLDARRELGADQEPGTADDLSVAGLPSYDFDLSLGLGCRAPGTLIREGEIQEWVW